MEAKPTVNALSTAKLPQTLEEAHTVILQLVEIVSGLTQRIEILEKENRELKERLTLNSKNSSLPPFKRY